jgi:hypothetical protein
MTVTNEELTKTFDLMFGQLPMTPEEEAAAAEYDRQQAEKDAQTQAALDRFVSDAATINDVLLLEKHNIVEAIYGAADDERPIGWQLRRTYGNKYSDQSRLEETGGRF